MGAGVPGSDEGKSLFGRVEIGNYWNFNYQGGGSYRVNCQDQIRPPEDAYDGVLARVLPHTMAIVALPVS